MKIRICDQSGNEIEYNLQLDDILDVIISFGDNKSLFIFNGSRIKSNDTPRSLGMNSRKVNYIDIIKS